MAAMNDKFSIIRSMVGMENRHESFQCYTGRAGGRPQDSEPAGGWPTFGSIVSRELGAGSNGALPYIDASPKMSYQPYANRGIHDNASKTSWPGFTGMSHVPFAVEADVKKDLVLNGINLSRLSNREQLLEQIDNIRHLPRQWNRLFQKKAFGLDVKQHGSSFDLKRKTRWFGTGMETRSLPTQLGAPPQSAQIYYWLPPCRSRRSLCHGSRGLHSNREGNRVSFKQVPS